MNILLSELPKVTLTLSPLTHIDVKYLKGEIKYTWQNVHLQNDAEIFCNHVLQLL